MDTNIWMSKAMETIKGMPTHKEFLVKDLFEDVEWGALSKGDRQWFGKTFKNAVKEGEFEGIVFIGGSR